MEPAKFNDLSMRDKVLLLDDLGQELLSIEFYDHRIYLYEFNSMLIEAYRNIETREIETIIVASYRDLDKFLTRITLPPILYKREKKDDQLT